MKRFDFKEILELIEYKTNHLTVGNPSNFDNFMGPLNDEKAFEKVMSYVEIGKKEGVEVEWIEDPVANARLVLLPAPTRVLLMTPKGIDIVWEAE